MFFASHVATNHAFATVKLYLAAVRSYHIRCGYDDPLKERPRLDLVLRGIKRSKGLHSRPQRLPVTINVLSAIQSALPRVVRHPHDQRLYWAICTTAFFGFFRIGELLSPTSPLSASDLSFCDGSLKIRLRVSKTDPFRRGCTVVIGRTSHRICAVRAMADYVAGAGTRLAQGQQTLFRSSDGSTVSRSMLVDTVRRCLVTSGLPNVGRYAGHSFRIGAATVAAQRNVAPWLIQAAGRWNSDCFLLYIRSNHDELAALAAHMAPSI